MKMDKKLSASGGLRPLTPTGADPGFARRRTTAKARNASLNGGPGAEPLVGAGRYIFFYVLTGAQAAGGRGQRHGYVQRSHFTHEHHNAVMHFLFIVITSLN